MRPDAAPSRARRTRATRVKTLILKNYPSRVNPLFMPAKQPARADIGGMAEASRRGGNGRVPAGGPAERAEAGVRRRTTA